MIEPIPGLPSHVLGFRAMGAVTETDYKAVIVPAVERALSARSHVRFLYHLGPEFSGFEPAALWEDAKIGFKHLASWEKVAVVTDVDWIRAATKLFGMLLPGHVRLFSHREIDAARQWVCA